MSWLFFWPPYRRLQAETERSRIETASVAVETRELVEDLKSNLRRLDSVVREIGVEPDAVIGEEGS